LALIILVVTMTVSHNIRGLLYSILPDQFRLEAGAGYAFALLVRYAIMVIGFILAFGVIGIAWSRVQWLVAGLSVGLGFGLQDIFANAVSGIILLFERPVRVGDIVSIGGIDGEVTSIRVRATTILDFDRREVIVPNRDIVTARLVNSTLTDSICRLPIAISVPHGSEPAAVEKLLLESAAANPKVLREPAPQAVLEQFVDNALLYKLYVFVPRRQFAEVMRNLNPAIAEAFHAAGIRLAFPPRDVRFDHSSPLDVRILSQAPDTTDPTRK